MRYASGRFALLIVVGSIAFGNTFPVLASRATTAGDVSGRIFAADLRTPVSDVTVHAVRDGARVATATVTTDRRGGFAFSQLPGGPYLLLITDKSGAPLAAAPVTAAEGTSSSVTLALPALRPGESAVAPAEEGQAEPPKEEKKKKGGWRFLKNPLGAALTLVVSAVVLAVGADALTKDNEDTKDLPPVTPSVP